MRIAIVTVGSRGEVQPYVALGLGLQRAGHHVRIAASPEFESFVRAYGIEFRAVGDNIQALMSDRQARATIDRGGNRLSKVRSMARKTEARLALLMRDAWAACQGADAIIGSSIGGLAAQPIAERLDIPYCAAYLSPFHRTRAFPHSFSLLPPLPAGWSTGRATYNRLSHMLTTRLFWRLFRPTLERAQRATLGVTTAADHQHVVLYGYSATVVPKPADWGERLHVTGYWFLDRPDGWQPPAELLRFLDAGPPPVYIGFGSVGHATDRLLALIIEALGRAGQRGLFVRGASQIDASVLPKHIHTIDSVPHDWLFPRVAAILHHGGAGTTAAALRSGVPQLMLPFLGDQHFWGQRVAALGCGPQPLARKRVTAEQLASAISALIADDQLQARVDQVAQQIGAEDGVAQAVHIFDSHVAGQCALQQRAEIHELSLGSG